MALRGVWTHDLNHMTEVAKITTLSDDTIQFPMTTSLYELSMFVTSPLHTTRLTQYSRNIPRHLYDFHT